MQVYRTVIAPDSGRANGSFAATLLMAVVFSVGGCGASEPPTAASAVEAETDAAPVEADAGATAPEVAPPPAIEPGQPAPPKPLPPPEDAERLSPDHGIWISVERGEVIIDGNISLRRGVLEMFACTRNTKEHESIISANTQAFMAHAALLRLGAKVGAPAQWDPEYAPPSGGEITIEVVWRDEESGQMKRRPAQEWVRNADTGEEMTLPWVFAGSLFWKDEESGREYYLAEQGNFICVSNFGDAMLDVPTESTQAQEGLLFEAYTERIPPLGAPVRMILRPAEQAEGGDAAPESTE